MNQTLVHHAVDFWLSGFEGSISSFGIAGFAGSNDFLDGVGSPPPHLFHIPFLPAGLSANHLGLGGRHRDFFAVKGKQTGLGYGATVVDT